MYIYVLVEKGIYFSIFFFEPTELCVYAAPLSGKCTRYYYRSRLTRANESPFYNIISEDFWTDELKTSSLLTRAPLIISVDTKRLIYGRASAGTV